MERLTFRHDCPYSKFHGRAESCEPIHCIDEHSVKARNAVVDRLADYEDKIPFDRLDEAAALVEAKKEGRLVVLPCKPNTSYLHRNYDTGGLELNIEIHDFGVDFEERGQCACWE